MAMKSIVESKNTLDLYLNILEKNLLDMNREIDILVEELKDQDSRIILSKMKELILINNTINSLRLADFIIKIRENQLEIDNELLAISDSVSKILEVHIEEAQSLRKIR